MATSYFLPLGAVSAVLFLVLAAGLGIYETYLQWELHMSLERAPRLPPVDTFKEEDLSWETFYNSYVMEQRPVKIVLKNATILHRQLLRERCGDNKVTLISDATFTAMGTVKNNMWLTIGFEWIAMPLLGQWTTLQAELDRRIKVPLREYLDYAEDNTTTKAPPTFELPIPLFLKRVLPKELRLLLEVFARPLYLHDSALAQVCPEAFEWINVPNFLNPNFFWPSARFQDMNKAIKDEPTFFLGKVHSMSYPMHQNVLKNFDFALMMLEGSKHYALFDVREGPKLNKVRVGRDISLYMVDAMNPDLIESPRYQYARGWSGLLRAGEILWAPGKSIHSFVNRNFTIPSSAVKFWYLSHKDVCGEKKNVTSCAASWGLPLGSALQRSLNIDEYVYTNLQGKAPRKTSSTADTATTET